MSSRQSVEGLQIASELVDFIEQEALPGTGIEAANFWKGLSAKMAMRRL